MTVSKFKGKYKSTSASHKKGDDKALHRRFTRTKRKIAVTHRATRALILLISDFGIDTVSGLAVSLRLVALTFDLTLPAFDVKVSSSDECSLNHL